MIVFYLRTLPRPGPGIEPPPALPLCHAATPEEDHHLLRKDDIQVGLIKPSDR